MRPRSVFNLLRSAILAYSLLSDDFFFFFHRRSQRSARNADIRPLFDHKFRIGVNANIQGIVQFRTKSRSHLYPLYATSLSVPRRRRAISLLALRALPKFIPPSRGSQPRFYLPATHMFAKQKNLPSRDLFVRYYFADKSRRCD